jgi:iron complex outermembrane recepter protein
VTPGTILINERLYLYRCPNPCIQQKKAGDLHLNTNSGFIVNFGAAVLLLGPGLSAPALAQTTNAEATREPQTTSGSELGEIIVTAEKRNTNLERTPVAITALNSAALADNQVHNLEDVQALIPSFKAGTNQGVAQVTIRGIGISDTVPGTEAAVAVNVNQVYVSRTVAQLTGLFDISQIEVLRGPQGTLYGRNATAGAVNITTALPTRDFSGYTRLTGGNYGEARLEGAVSGPLINDTLAVRLAGFGERHDGYGTNLVTGEGIDNEGTYGFRGTMLFTPTPEIKGTVYLDYYKEDDHSGGFHYFGAAGLTGLPGAIGIPPSFITEGGYAPQNIRDVASQLDPQFYLRTGSATAVLEWNPDDAFGLKSITGYRDQQWLITHTAGGGSVLSEIVHDGEAAHQISEEIDAHYDVGELQLTGGAYFFHENDDADPLTSALSTTLLGPLYGIAYPSQYIVDFISLASHFSTQAEAVFAQGRYNLTPQLSLTAGVRYSVERKTDEQFYGINLTAPYTGSNPLPPGVEIPSVKFYATTPTAGVEYQLDRNTLLYFTYAQGFKAGGFDTGVQDPVPYRPEHLTDYEGGLKTTMLEGHLRANVSAYYYDYTDLQVQQVFGTTVQTENAATAKIYGTEAELSYILTDAFQVSGNAAWVHARYVDYSGPDPARPLLAVVDFSGHALDNAPDFTADISPQYTWHGSAADFIVRPELEYSSRFYFSPGNIALLSQGDYVKENLFLTYRPQADRWSVSAYCKNISNRTTKTGATVQTTITGSPVQGTLAPPRLAGVELNYKF